MVLRRHEVRVIQAAGRDVDLVRKVRMLKSELRAAAPAKAAPPLGARPEAGRRPLDEPELRPRHAEPRDEGRTARAPANRAMAARFMERRARGLVAHQAAIAAA